MWNWKSYLIRFLGSKHWLASTLIGYQYLSTRRIIDYFQVKYLSSSLIIFLLFYSFCSSTTCWSCRILKCYVNLISRLQCLAAGSSIMNREEESAAMRPLAKALTRSLETVRSLLREQCLRPRGMALSQHDDMLHESLRIFDRLV